MDMSDGKQTNPAAQSDGLNSLILNFTGVHSSVIINIKNKCWMRWKQPPLISCSSTLQPPDVNFNFYSARKSSCRSDIRNYTTGNITALTQKYLAFFSRLQGHDCWIFLTNGPADLDKIHPSICCHVSDNLDRQFISVFILIIIGGLPLCSTSSMANTRLLH